MSNITLTPLRIEDAQFAAAHPSLITAREAGVLNEKRCKNTNTKDNKTQIPNIPPPFCRQGNKFPMREEIIRLIPKHTRYVEPFLGSGAIFYNKPVVLSQENILNDLDKHTYDQHRLIIDAPIDPAKYPRHLNTIPAIKRFYRKTPKNAAERLIHEKIEACNGFSGSPVRLSYGIYRKADPTKILKNLTFYKSRLNDNVTLLNQDYATVVRTYDSPSTFFFFDPPYERTRSIYGYGEHKTFDYSKLLDVLRSIRGKFLMTINDSQNIREVFRQFRIQTTRVYARWSRKTKKATDRKELLIMNY
jgi:DNA adenine methylase